MAYGFKTFNAAGALRVYEGSWIFKYHSTHTITAPQGGTKTVYITGFDPNIWGIQVVDVSSPQGEGYEWVFRVSMGSGWIKVYGGSFSSLTVKFNLFKA